MCGESVGVPDPDPNGRSDSDSSDSALPDSERPASDRDPAARARRYVLDEHASTVATVLACAEVVAERWDCPSTTDASAVAGPLRAELEVAGAWGRLPDVLAGAVRAAGFALSAPPVADPPYVVATGRGPVLRATVSGGNASEGTVSEGRLVVLLRAFEVARDPTRYVRGPTAVREAVCATFK
ncbi:hypothetical protein [Halorussus litoreus]|uniref:hypothetical protein n=1 Tax=Halorussus litoreus TaxID=1710536 RepID=UPI001E5FF37E|nr:hypothetical protein [Halorussus litoreus]